jgi:hypothetical protein
MINSNLKQMKAAGNQQLQEVDRQKSTIRLRVKNQVIIDCMGQVYRQSPFKPLANDLQS